MDISRFSILVGVDFSPVAELGFREAIRLARRTGATVDVVHIVPSSVEAATELLGARSRELPALRRADDRFVGYFAYAAFANVPMSAHLRMGDAATQLLATIDELRPDLVVLGSHGDGAVRRALVGSVGHEVWLKSASHVLLVPPRRADRSLEARAADQTVPAVAWSCKGCGRIFGEGDSPTRCSACGADPAHWFGASIQPSPVDALLSSVGHAAGEGEARIDGAGSSTVQVGPPGTSGYDVNPELRVRY